MAQTLPLAHWRLRQTQVFGSNAVQSDQQIVVRPQFDVIARRRRAIENHRSEIVAVGRMQVFDKTV